jgi:tRNA pseudouridine55 synthase
VGSRDGLAGWDGVGQREPGPGGFIIVDKPAGMTSHDVVARVRRLANTRRVGHGGTLDPMATGVLVIGVERATRLLTYVVGSGKRYLATIRLGQSTVTDDAEGEVTGGGDASTLTRARVAAGLAALTGDIEQVPSAVSAIKVAGRRSYARVRAGEQVSLDARPVSIRLLDLLALRSPEPHLLDVDVDVTCSSGTYVRAIARDLGQGLGVGGHLTALRRTEVGGFTLAEAVGLDELAAREDPVTLPLAAAAGRFLPRREASAEQARVLSHGGALPAVGLTGPYAVFDPAGALIAVVRERDGAARPEAVLAAP